MNSWFVEPEVPPQPRPGPIPWHPWLRRPDNELGVLVPTQMELARRPTLVLAVMAIYAFSCGFEISLVLRQQPTGDPALPWTPRGHWADDLHFGVEFEDGRRTSKGLGPDVHLKAWTDAYWTANRQPEPVGPTMMSFGGGGSHGSTVGHSWTNWIWPLPPGSWLRLGWEWRGQGIEFDTRSIEVGPIRRAAAASNALWEPQTPSTGV